MKAEDDVFVCLRGVAVDACEQEGLPVRLLLCRYSKPLTFLNRRQSIRMPGAPGKDLLCCLGELLLPLRGSGQITIFLQQGDQVGDGPGVGGGGGEEVSKLEQIASSLALSSA